MELLGHSFVEKENYFSFHRYAIHRVVAPYVIDCPAALYATACAVPLYFIELSRTREWSCTILITSGLNIFLQLVFLVALFSKLMLTSLVARASRTSLDRNTSNSVAAYSTIFYIVETHCTTPWCTMSSHFS